MGEVWDVIDNSRDLLITGPGGLEIVIPKFYPSKTVVDKLDERLFREWKQVTVKYPLENPVFLEITITTQDKDSIALLSIGEYVTWYVDLEFGDKLQSVLLGRV